MDNHEVPRHETGRTNESFNFEKIGALCLGSTVLFTLNSIEHFSKDPFSFNGGLALALDVTSAIVGYKAIKKSI